MALEKTGLHAVITGMGQFRSASKEIDRSFDRLSKGSERAASRMSKLGEIAKTAIGFAVGQIAVKGIGALVSSMGTAINVAADFESQINILGIAARSSGTSMDVLREASLKVGADTELVGISASQAADAITAMYKAGLDTAAIFGDLDAYMKGTTGLSGVLRAAVDLQAASELNLAQATDVVSVAMATFGLSEKDAIAIADSFIKTADASVAEVFDLTEAMRNVGPVAAQFGWSLQDVNTALGILSTRGIKGSEAGTSLRAMFTNLMRPTDQVTDALDELGVNLYDAEGNMKSLDKIVGDLSKAFTGSVKVTKKVGGATKEQTKLLKKYQREIDKANESLKEYRAGAKGATLTDKTRAKKMAELTKKVALYEKEKAALNITEGKLVTTTRDLTEEQKNQYIQTLAGTYGMRAMNTLLAEGAEGWEKQVKLIEEAATAQEVATARTKGFRAAMEQLRGVLESLWIRVGTPLIENFLTPATKALSELLEMAITTGAGIEGGLSQRLSGVGDKILEWIEPKIPGLLEMLDRLLTATADWMGRVAIPKAIDLSIDFTKALFGLAVKPGWEREQIEGLSKGVAVIEHEIGVWERQLAPGVRIGMPTVPGMKIGLPAPPEVGQILTPEWRREMIATAAGVGGETIDVIHREISEGMAVGMPAPPPTLSEIIAEGFKEIGRNAASAFWEGLTEGMMETGTWERLKKEVVKVLEKDPLTKAFRKIGKSLDVKKGATPRKEAKQLGEDIAGDAIEGTEAILQIRSASKVYERIGREMAEGMADGLQSSWSVWKVTDALLRLVGESRYQALPMIQHLARQTGYGFVDHAAMGVRDSLYMLANAMLWTWTNATQIALDAYQPPILPAPIIEPPTPPAPPGPYDGYDPTIPPGYQFGGVVPGPRGDPRWAVVHGGEIIVNPSREQVPAMVKNNIIYNITNYGPTWSPTVQASYLEQQDPGSVAGDLETLAILYRMGP